LNILIIGGYSFIGIKLAEKFFSEENNITIADSRKERSSELEIKHHHFVIRRGDERLSKVFASKRFDVVIYLPENGQDFKALSDTLELCTRSRVKKFIVTSNPDIYASQKERLVSESLRLDPKTSKGMNELVKEYYCLKWGELNGLKVVVARQPVLYGPKEHLSKRPSPIFDILKSALFKKKPVINEDHSIIKDYLYIDDFTEAVYMLALDEGIKGIFNVSSSEAHDLEEIIDIFGKEKDGISKKASIKASTSTFGLALDNKKLTQNTKWIPRTNLSEGIEKALHYYSSLVKDKKGLKDFLKEKKPKPQKKRIPPVIGYIENILLFCVIAFLQYSEIFFGIKLFNLNINYIIVYIIIMEIL